MRNPDAAYEFGNTQPGLMGASSPGGWQQAGESALGMGSGMSGLGGALGGLGGALGGLLGGMFGGQSPMDAYNQYASGIPGTLEQYLGPYAQMGQQMLPQMQQLYGGLVSDPGQELAQLGSGFQADPGYNWQKQQALQAGQQAAAAGGMAGTPAAQQQAETTASGLANQQYQQYLRNVMGLYGQGLGGLQGLESQGFGAAQGLGQDLAQALSAQAAMAAQQAQQKQSGLGSIFGAIGSALPGIISAL